MAENFTPEDARQIVVSHTIAIMSPSKARMEQFLKIARGHPHPPQRDSKKRRKNYHLDCTEANHPFNVLHLARIQSSNEFVNPSYARIWGARRKSGEAGSADVDIIDTNWKQAEPEESVLSDSESEFAPPSGEVSESEDFTTPLHNVTNRSRLVADEQEWRAGRRVPRPRTAGSVSSTVTPRQIHFRSRSSSIDSESTGMPVPVPDVNVRAMRPVGTAENGLPTTPPRTTVHFQDVPETPPNRRLFAPQTPSSIGTMSSSSGGILRTDVPGLVSSGYEYSDTGTSEYSHPSPVFGTPEWSTPSTASVSTPGALVARVPGPPAARALNFDIPETPERPSTPETPERPSTRSRTQNLSTSTSPRRTLVFESESEGTSSPRKRSGSPGSDADEKEEKNLETDPEEFDPKNAVSCIVTFKSLEHSLHPILEVVAENFPDLQFFVSLKLKSPKCYEGYLLQPFGKLTPIEFEMNTPNRDKHLSPEMKAAIETELEQARFILNNFIDRTQGREFGKFGWSQYNDNYEEELDEDPAMFGQSWTEYGGLQDHVREKIVDPRIFDQRYPAYSRRRTRYRELMKIR